MAFRFQCSIHVHMYPITEVDVHRARYVCIQEFPSVDRDAAKSLDRGLKPRDTCAFRSRRQFWNLLRISKAPRGDLCKTSSTPSGPSTLQHTSYGTNLSSDHLLLLLLLPLLQLLLHHLYVHFRLANSSPTSTCSGHCWTSTAVRLANSSPTSSCSGHCWTSTAGVR